MSPKPEPEQINFALYGEEIYNRDFREAFERDHPGRYALIEVSSGQAFIGATPIEALQAARYAAPRGRFHLVRVAIPAGNA